MDSHAHMVNGGSFHAHRRMHCREGGGVVGCVNTHLSGIVACILHERGAVGHNVGKLTDICRAAYWAKQRWPIGTDGGGNDDETAVAGMFCHC